jgi:ATP synthase subunit 6
MISSPLEQFSVDPSFFVRLIEQFSLVDGAYNLNGFFVSNYMVTLMEIFFLITFFYCIFIELLSNENLIGRNLINLTSFYYKLTYKQVNTLNINFLFILIVLYLFISLINLGGMVTYSTTATAQLAVTFFTAAAFMTYINTSSIIFHNSKFFGLFFPAGSPLSLAVLIVPIEFISYFFKKISLSVRLFANMMAGHTLLKVIVGFVQVYFLTFDLGIIFNASLTFGLISPILIALVALELGVALIQGYVFASLASMYSLDAKNLH